MDSGYLDSFGILSPLSSLELLTPSLLTLGASLLPSANGTLWTNLSVIQSYNWFFQLTRFEAIFFGIILMHFVIGNAIGVLPLRINSLFNGGPPNPGFVRKKRSLNLNQLMRSTDKLIVPMLKILDQADHEKCFQKTLCEIQLKMTCDQQGYQPSRDILMIMNGLQATIKLQGGTGRPKIEEKPMKDNVFAKLLQFLRPFETAIETGMTKLDMKYRNSTIGVKSTNACAAKYHDCSLSTDDIFYYLDILDKNWFHK